MHNIIVGVDGSTSSGLALAWADREAARHGTKVTAVLAWGFLTQHHEDPAAEFDPAYAEPDARKALDAYIERAVDPRRAGGVERRLVCDLPFRALIDAVEPDDLLVLGSRGRGGFAGLLLGSVSQQVLHHAPCAVAIVRETSARPTDAPDRIVVGVDGSTSSHSALQWAFEEAQRRDGVLVVVHVSSLSYTGGYPYGSMDVDPAQFEATGRQILDEALATIDTSELSHPVERIHGIGSATTMLIDEAADADLIVVASRGLGGFSGLLLGSVSHQLAHHAPCPLVVVPAR